MVLKRNRPPSRMTGELGRVRVALAEPEGSGIGGETLWAEEIAPGRHRLRSVPFFAYDLSCEDVVAVRAGGQEVPEVVSVSIRGGHSTYRLFLDESVEVNQEAFVQFWTPLEQVGCTYERATRRLLAIDVPARADIHHVYSLLVKGEEAGVWEFEEAHCGHPVSRESEELG